MQERISCRAAALIIKGNYLHAAKSIDHPCYYIIGGGIEIGESSEEAIVRELFEETGLRFEVDRLAIIQERFCEVNNEKYHEIVFFYLMKENVGMDIPVNCPTDQGIKETPHWLPLEGLATMQIIPEFLKTMKLNTMTDIRHIISKEI